MILFVGMMMLLSQNDDENDDDDENEDGDNYMLDFQGFNSPSSILSPSQSPLHLNDDEDEHEDRNEDENIKLLDNDHDNNIGDQSKYDPNDEITNAVISETVTVDDEETERRKSLERAIHIQVTAVAQCLCYDLCDEIRKSH